MKKIFSYVLLFAFLVFLVGCEKGEQYVDPNGLGIEMTLRSVSTTGATVVFTLHSDDKSNQAWTGAAYWLEKEENGSWERAPVITDVIAWFAADTYTVKANAETEILVDWSDLYGELEPGKYRIGKEILGKRESEHSSWYTYYAEFEIANITC